MVTIITYILKTLSGEFYCGKTNNLPKRLLEHKQEKYPHWFASKNRKKFSLVCELRGDYEKKIKQFGIKNFIECTKFCLSPR